MRLVLLLLAGCLPELAGCLPDGVDDAVVMRGRHVTVYADPAIPVCEDALAAADRFVEDTATVLGVSPPAIDYYLFDGPTNCGTGQYATASCEIAGNVYANAWIHFHELAHAVDRSHPPALFVEGLAEALSIPSDAARRNLDLAHRATAQLPLESTEFRAGPPDQNYRVAGDFVRYLLERYGGPRYRAFARAVLSLADQITIRSAFERAYERPLDEVIAEWRLADPGGSALVVPVDLVECHDPIPPIGVETWAVDEVVPNACASGVTRHGTSYVQHTRRYGFEVTEPGLFMIHVAGTTEHRGIVRSCTDGELHEYATSVAASRASSRFLTVPLRRGRHAIEMVEGVTAWRVERLGDVGKTCETAPTFTAPTSAPWRLEFQGRSGAWIRIAHDDARTLSVSTTSPAYVCTGECADQRCRPLTGRRPVESNVGPIYVRLPESEADAQSVTVEVTDP